MQSLLYGLHRLFYGLVDNIAAINSIILLTVMQLFILKLLLPVVVLICIISLCASEFELIFIIFKK